MQRNNEISTSDHRYINIQERERKVNNKLSIKK